MLYYPLCELHFTEPNSTYELGLGLFIRIMDQNYQLKLFAYVCNLVCKLQIRKRHYNNEVNLLESLSRRDRGMSINTFLWPGIIKFLPGIFSNFSVKALMRTKHLIRPDKNSQEHNVCIDEARGYRIMHIEKTKTFSDINGYHYSHYYHWNLVKNCKSGAQRKLETDF